MEGELIAKLDLDAASEGAPENDQIAIEWGGFVGGVATDYIIGVDVTPDGDIVCAGHTELGIFDGLSGRSPEGTNPADVFAARVSAGTGAIQSVTLVGGSLEDLATAFALREDGTVLVGGWTTSSDFPTTPGVIGPGMSEPFDGFLLALSPDLAALVFSTYIEDDNSALEIKGIAASKTGEVTMVGSSYSSAFPTTPGSFMPDDPDPGNSDGYIMRLDAAGASVEYSTYIGGLGVDTPRAVALRDDGVCIVAGSTSASNFPVTTGAFDTTFGSNFLQPDAFVAALDASGSSLLWSSYLGGSFSDWAYAVSADASGSVTVAGLSNSVEFPTTPGVFDEDGVSTTAVWDLFLTRLSSDGSMVLTSTFLGVAEDSGPLALHVDPSGLTTVTGPTRSHGWPTTDGAFQESVGPNETGVDAFVTRLDPGFERMIYSTYLSGTDDENRGIPAVGLFVAPDGWAVAGGRTDSADFPVLGAEVDSTFGGQQDGFLVRLEMLPKGVTRHGVGTPWSGGPLQTGAFSWPALGEQGFALTCGNAPPQARGLLLLGSTLADPAQLYKGTSVWLEPASLFAVLPVTAGSDGFVAVRLPIPGDSALVGFVAGAQWFWPDGATNAETWGATSGLRVQIQP